MIENQVIQNISALIHPGKFYARGYIDRSWAVNNTGKRGFQPHAVEFVMQIFPAAALSRSSAFLPAGAVFG